MKSGIEQANMVISSACLTADVDEQSLACIDVEIAGPELIVSRDPVEPPDRRLLYPAQNVLILNVHVKRVDATVWVPIHQRSYVSVVGRAALEDEPLVAIAAV